jgi:hypothetical protein
MVATKEAIMPKYAMEITVTRSKRWMQVVGGLYLLNFVMVSLVRAPVRALGPAGALSQASAGDPLARFLVDTWVVYGLEVGVIGAALLVASRAADQSRTLIWTVLGIELVRGILADSYMIVRGYAVTPMAIWIVIHSAIIATGLLSLRSEAARERSRPVVVP